MKVVITNERGQLEEITYKEDKSAWYYAGATLLLVVGTLVGGWLFLF